MPSDAHTQQQEEEQKKHRQDECSLLLRKLEALGPSSESHYRKTREALVLGTLPEDERQKLWAELNQRAGSAFCEVFQYELDALSGQVPDATSPASPAAVNWRAHKQQLAGLAFSGGGIRSATFNLGVLQALAEMRLLREFDYLSTVSGGGYIGGWLSKWIKESGGKVEAVEAELAGLNDRNRPRVEPKPIQFLRQYSNYLTPKTGLFSADTWTLICTYCRNTMLNMAMLVAWLSALFLLPRLLVAALPDKVSYPAASNPGGVELWPYAVFFFLWSVYFIALSISRKGTLPGKGWLAQSQGNILMTVCLPLMLSCLLGSLAICRHADELAAFWDGMPFSLQAYPYHWLLAPGVVYCLVWAAGWLTALWMNRHAGGHVIRSGKREVLGHFLCAVGALAAGSILLLKCLSLLHGMRFGLIAVVSFGMPLLLSLFGVTITLMIGLIGRLYRDQSREWWARQGAWTTIFTIGWLALFVAAFYLPPLLDWAFQNYVKTASVGTGLATLATWLGLKSGSSKDSGKIGAPLKLELAAQLAPYAFSLLIIGALSNWLQFLVAQPVVSPHQLESLRHYLDEYMVASAHAGGGQLVWACVLFLVGACVLGFRVDINVFSLYMMYRMRLVRAYFGASNPERKPHPFTGFDPNDDPKLETLLRQTATPPPAVTVAGETRETPPAKLQRPYHLINAAINMVNGKELAWQSRKAGNFCFTPGYCGFEMPVIAGAGTAGHLQRGAYRPTGEYAIKTRALKDDDAGVKLGMAVAVSGAAASPNMGYHTSPPLSFLMTLFNLRLGRWSPNPMKEHAWKYSSPSIGLGSILLELFGLTDAEANFLYLSDGGHFENLGVYELVRRRCKLIVAIDASCDNQQTFEDLGNAIRKCRTDLNIPITLDAGKIRTARGPGESGASFVIGRIRYRQTDGAGHDGVLLYIKPTIVGSENADVLNYAKMHPGFPHQSTADQWFDEDQFESYRTLGYQIANDALAKVAADSIALDGGNPQHRNRIARLCRLLSKPAAPDKSAKVLPLRA